MIRIADTCSLLGESLLHSLNETRLAHIDGQLTAISNEKTET